MMGYELPPVGERVVLNRGINDQPFVVPGKAFYLDSGTSALVIALKAAVLRARSLKPLAEPEVLLPAYACPDLISAAVYAGIKPILIDFQYGSPRLDLDFLKSQIRAESVAIIAVNFLGLRENLPALRQVANEYDLALIEDNAQAVPFCQENKITGEAPIGDMAIMSFGRGKPISLLGGGLVYSCNENYFEALALLTESLKQDSSSRLKFLLKTTVYNLLINPYLYWVPASLPFLKIGKVAYKPFDHVRHMARVNRRILNANANGYLKRNYPEISLLNDGIKLLAEKNVVNLGAETLLQNENLLRYPILLPDSSSRDRVYLQLKKAGLGVTVMYGTPLNRMDDVQGLVGEGIYSNADDFSKRLLTLPVTQALSRAGIGKILRIINEAIE